MKEENPGTVDEFIKGLDKEVPESSQIADHNKRLENMLKNPEKEHMQRYMKMDVKKFKTAAANYSGQPTEDSDSLDSKEKGAIASLQQSLDKSKLYKILQREIPATELGLKMGQMKFPISVENQLQNGLINQDKKSRILKHRRTQTIDVNKAGQGETINTSNKLKAKYASRLVEKMVEKRIRRGSQIKTICSGSDLDRAVLNENSVTSWDNQDRKRNTLTAALKNRLKQNSWFQESE